MGSNSLKCSSGELKDATIVAIHVNGNGIMFGVDSLSSNEKYQGIEGNHNKQSEWHLTNKDDANKVFPMSSNSNIVAVKAGCESYDRDYTNMCQWVKDKVSKSQIYSNDALSVSFIYEQMIEYLKCPDGKDKEFGTIIAGWDEDEGYQICRVLMKDNNVAKDKNCGYASLGSGQHWADAVMESRYDYNMTVEDAADLVLKSLFYQTLYNKHSGEFLGVYQVNEKGCHKISAHNSLEAYCRYYESCNEKNILFLVCSSTQQPFTADDLITSFFRKYGIVAMAGHRVAHCVSKKQQGVGFYFHRLVFSETQASKVYSQIEAENGQKARPRDLAVADIYKKFDYRVELNTRVHGRDETVPVYVSRSSIDLLQEMVSTSRVNYKDPVLENHRQSSITISKITSTWSLILLLFIIYFWRKFL